ncbi:TonB-dependent receptor [Daejeonella oryzae]|uniref:TonB-dependent receptor n=1 Tax=Daejeonella oryzae TaxID=1122943 RepID=UPI001C65B219|nr:TonB-dependent receptor [Daejeonella oryzae]
MKKIVLFLILVSFIGSVNAQTNQLELGVVQGKVTDALSNAELQGVSVQIQGTTRTGVSDTSGNFTIAKLKPGVYNIQFTYVGYKPYVAFDIIVVNSKASIVNASLEIDASLLNEVQINTPVFYKPVESPLSLRSIGSTEIKRNPGGNRDISKVIQSLPGVSAPVSFRNDIIIRGGAPNENRFYIDGVEIPNINHFATQGSSGGPVGLINVDFIREVDFYSGAFPASRGNALSSVFEFKQKDGREDKLSTSLTAGSSDLAATLEGPLSPKTTFISSYRYSYLQGLFKLIGLPFLPSYQDFQFKTKTKFNSKNELTLLGLGAIDRFKLNFGSDPTEQNLYILKNVPVNLQDNYTVGANYKNFRDKGYSIFILSRNYLNNGAEKFQVNDESKIKILDYSSKEIENKFRFENYSREGAYRINFGAGIETATYKTNTLNILPFNSEIYNSDISFLKYGFFGQLSRTFIEGKLNLSLGLRADANTYSDKMTNLLNTFSPRFSASYNFTEKFSANFNTGIYYQLPAYTILGYREETAGPLVNKNVKYIRSDQVVVGLEYNTLANTRFTLEGFYKAYDNYPIIRVLGNQIPLANLGADFGVVGNKPVTGFTVGRSYGLEFLAQQKLNKSVYGIMALTLFRSEFEDKNNEYVQSSWNSRYIISMTGGKIFKRNWEIGAKFRLTGGSPYTPYDIAASSLKENFNVYPQGIQDYERLNENQLKDFYQVDLRIDKKYPFRKFNLNIYLDIQNLTYNKYQLQPILLLDQSADGTPQDDPADASRYKTKLLNNENGNILPTLGIIFEL